MSAMAMRFARLACVATLVVPAFVQEARAQQSQAPIKVVASFSVIGDLVRAVGGERIALTTLVGPGGESHVYTPSPADARTVAAAKLVVVNGLGFEGWLPRLVASAGKRANVVEASAGIAPRKMQGEGRRDTPDPHAWQSVTNAKVYVANIRDALAAADPAGAAAYSKAAAAYLDKLDGLDRELREAIASIPPQNRRLVTTHDAFGYLAAAYGLEAIALQGVSTDSEPTARAIAALVTEIRARRIPVIFREPATDPRMVDRIASETGARIGGVLYSDSLTAANGDAPTYIDMIRHNIKTLTSALGGSSR